MKVSMTNKPYTMTINRETGAIVMHGVDTGTMTALSINFNDGLLMAHTQGGNYWSGIGMTSYSPAKISVFPFEFVEMNEKTIKIRTDLFGSVTCPPRGYLKHALEIRGNPPKQ